MPAEFAIQQHLDPVRLKRRHVPAQEVVAEHYRELVPKPLRGGEGATNGGPRFFYQGAPSLHLGVGQGVHLQTALLHGGDARLLRLAPLGEEPRSRPLGGGFELWLQRRIDAVPHPLVQDEGAQHGGPDMAHHMGRVGVPLQEQGALCRGRKGGDQARLQGRRDLGRGQGHHLKPSGFPHVRLLGIPRKDEELVLLAVIGMEEGALAEKPDPSGFGPAEDREALVGIGGFETRAHLFQDVVGLRVISKGEGDLHGVDGLVQRRQAGRGHQSAVEGTQLDLAHHLAVAPGHSAGIDLQLEFAFGEGLPLVSEVFEDRIKDGPLGGQGRELDLLRVDDRGRAEGDRDQCGEGGPEAKPAALVGGGNSVHNNKSSRWANSHRARFWAIRLARR